MPVNGITVPLAGHQAQRARQATLEVAHEPGLLRLRVSDVTVELPSRA
jgi:hypothetical protein